MSYQRVQDSHHRAWIRSLALCVALGAGACGGESASSVEVTELETAERIPSWEEFERTSRRVSPEGEVFYMVQWDLPLRTEAELFDYYTAVTSDVEKGVLHLHQGQDDVWQNNDQQKLQYCVDVPGFDAPPVGANSTTIVNAMAAATFAWAQVVNVSFRYDSANNGNCERADPIPGTTYFKVSRFDGLGGGCAFGPLSHAGWTCPGLDGNTIGVDPGVTLPSDMSWTYLLMHELGHALGLHHEFFHTGGGCGIAPGQVRDVTTAMDSPSVMGYASAWEPFCSLTDPSMTALSAGDGWTVREFYGMPAAWYVPTVLTQW